MNFQQAVELAKVIESSPAFELVAVGRFVPVAELRPVDPWGCSVLIRSTGKSRVVWTPGEFADLVDPPAVVAPAAATRRDAEHLRQPTLF